MRQGEGARSLWDVIRTLFARRPDPYAGNDVDNARRLGGLMWLIYGTVAAIVLALAPPTGRYAPAAAGVGALIVVHSLLRGYRWVTRPGPGFGALLAGSYVALAQLPVLQASRPQSPSWIAAGPPSPGSSWR